MSSPDADALDRADMARLTAGHDTALNDLMERHATPVFHFLCRMLRNEDDANDFAQETFARVYRHRDSYQADAKFSTWLYTIAANLARNHLRWRARHPSFSLDGESTETGQSIGDALPAPHAAPDADLATKERALAVRNAVSHLPDDLREAIVLCELDDHAIAEAAVILATTPKAVESRLYRARQVLQKRLARWL